jgi:hypothetical protein
MRLSALAKTAQAILLYTISLFQCTSFLNTERGLYAYCKLNIIKAASQELRQI